MKLNVKLQACETVEALAVQFKKLINGSGKICAIAKLAFGAVIWNISTKNNRRFFENRSVQRSKVMNTICESSRGSDDRPLNNNNNSINININYYIYIKDRLLESLGWKAPLYILHKPQYNNDLDRRVEGLHSKNGG